MALRFCSSNIAGSYYRKNTDFHVQQPFIPKKIQPTSLIQSPITPYHGILPPQKAPKSSLPFTICANTVFLTKISETEQATKLEKLRKSGVTQQRFDNVIVLNNLFSETDIARLETYCRSLDSTTHTSTVFNKDITKTGDVSHKNKLSFFDQNNPMSICLEKIPLLFGEGAFISVSSFRENRPGVLVSAGNQKHPLTKEGTLAGWHTDANTIESVLAPGPKEKKYAPISLAFPIGQSTIGTYFSRTSDLDNARMTEHKTGNMVIFFSDEPHSVGYGEMQDGELRFLLNIIVYVPVTVGSGDSHDKKDCREDFFKKIQDTFPESATKLKNSAEKSTPYRLKELNGPNPYEIKIYIAPITPSHGVVDIDTDVSKSYSSDPYAKNCLIAMYRSNSAYPKLTHPYNALAPIIRRQFTQLWMDSKHIPLLLDQKKFDAICSLVDTPTSPMIQSVSLVFNLLRAIQSHHNETATKYYIDQLNELGPNFLNLRKETPDKGLMILCAGLIQTCVQQLITHHYVHDSRYAHEIKQLPISSLSMTVEGHLDDDERLRLSHYIYDLFFHPTSASLFPYVCNQNRTSNHLIQEAVSEFKAMVTHEMQIVTLSGN
jgi:hypothetical protein